jgi:hypothetical protein
MTSSVGGKFVQVEALGPELIHGGVYMEQHTTETVVLVWVTLYRQPFGIRNIYGKSAGN